MKPVTELICTTYLWFHHLQQDLNVTIEWTRTLNEHLRLDSRRKVLHVFQLPSICLLLYEIRPVQLFHVSMRTSLENDIKAAKQENKRLNGQWTRLWDDRRNIAAWVALWAVLIIGSGTLLLQIIQLAFQILQVWSRHK